MARKQPPARRKRRTREHILADLAVNHVERQVLLGGHTVERISHDYGIDLMMFTYTPDGEIEDGPVYLQVKGTEQVNRVAGGQEISFRVERADLLYWLGMALPVVLIVYDDLENTAWWLHVQGHFRARPQFNVFRAGQRVTARISPAQVFDQPGIAQIARLRDEAMRRGT